MYHFYILLIFFADSKFNFICICDIIIKLYKILQVCESYELKDRSKTVNASMLIMQPLISSVVDSIVASSI